MRPLGSKLVFKIEISNMKRLLFYIIINLYFFLLEFLIFSTDVFALNLITEGSLYYYSIDESTPPTAVTAQWINDRSLEKSQQDSIQEALGGVSLTHLAHWMKQHNVEHLGVSTLEQFKQELLTQSDCQDERENILNPLGVLQSVNLHYERSTPRIRVPLADLIAKTADTKPEDAKLNHFVALEQLLQMHTVSLSRMEYVKQNVRVLGEFQFAQDMAIRELVSNALDSYYYDKKLAEGVERDHKTVQVHSNSHQKITVEDYGLGMSLEDAIFYLLTPARSSNGVILNPSEGLIGVTGRFGQGFFSVLSFLKFPTDQIVIESYKEGFPPIKITLSQEPIDSKPPESQIIVQIEPSHKNTHGTQISIHSESLSDEHRHNLDQVIAKFFKNTERGVIWVNDQQITDSHRGYSEHILLSNGMHLGLKRSVEPINQGKGVLDITVNGVLIKEFPLEGINIYPEVTLDFPSQTQLTSDRGVILYEDRENRKTITELLSYAEKTEDIALWNSLYPLLNDEAFHIIRRAKIHSKDHAILPALDEFKAVQSVKGKPVTWIHPQLVSRVHGNLLDTIQHWFGSDFRSHLFSAQLKTQDRLLLYANRQSNLSGVRQFFLDESQKLEHPWSIPVTETLINTRSRHGGEELSFRSSYLFQSQEHADSTSTMKDALVDPLLQSSHVVSVFEQEEMPDSFKVQVKQYIKERKLKAQKVFYKIVKESIGQNGSTSRLEPMTELEEDTYLQFVFKLLRQFGKQISSDQKKIAQFVDTARVLNIELALDLTQLKNLKDTPQYANIQKLSAKIYDLLADSGAEHEFILDFLSQDRNFIFSSLLQNFQQNKINKSVQKILDKNQEQAKTKVDALLKEKIGITLEQFNKDPERVLADPTKKEKINEILTDPELQLLQQKLTQMTEEKKQEKSNKDYVGRFISEKLLKFNQSFFEWIKHIFKEDFESISLLKKLPTYDSPISRMIQTEVDFNKLIDYQNRCRALGISRCTMLILDQFEVLKEIENIKPEALDFSFKYFDYFYPYESEFVTFNNKRSISYESSSASTSGAKEFAQFLISRFFNKELEDLTPDKHRILSHCFYGFLPSSWSRALWSLTNKPTEEQLRVNQEQILVSIMKILASPSEKQKIPLIEGMCKSMPFYPTTEDLQTHKSMEDLVNLMREKALVNETTEPFIFSYLFGGKASFLEADEHEGSIFAPTFIPLAEHPKFMEIISGDRRLNQKHIQGAIKQNPSEFVWVKELAKNAKEAGAKEIHVDVMRDRNQQMLVRFVDNGVGMCADQMHYFFIPKYSSKLKSSEDINFGWGFFTLFHTFEQVQIDSSCDGKTQSTVYLKWDGHQMLIAEKKQSGSFPRGTQLTFKKTGELSVTDPAFIQGHLIQVIGSLSSDGGKPIAIHFNGQTLDAINPYSLRSVKPTATRTMHYGKQGRAIDIDGFSHAKKGIYYNGLFHSSELGPYFSHLTDLVQSRFESLPIPLAVQLRGKLSQNATRTQFLEQTELVEPITEVLCETAFKQLAFQVGKEPHQIIKDLPQDFYYEFQNGYVNETEALSEVHGKSFSELGKTIKTPEALARYLTLLPLSDDSISLRLLRQKVREELEHFGIIDAYGKYIPGKKLEKNQLLNVITEMSLRKQVQVFEEQIQIQIEKLAKQANKPALSILGNTSEAQIIDELSYVDSFTPEKIESMAPGEIKNQLHQLKPTLEKMRSFLINQAQIMLHKTIDIQFYVDSNNSDAHNRQGTHVIEFNLKGHSFAQFQKMLDTHQFDHGAFLSIMSTLTHELIHATENTGQSTHDARFFRDQELLLQNLYQLNQNPVWVEEMKTFFHL